MPLSHGSSTGTAAASSSTASKSMSLSKGESSAVTPQGSKAADSLPLQQQRKKAASSNASASARAKRLRPSDSITGFERFLLFVNFLLSLGIFFTVLGGVLLVLTVQFDFPLAAVANDLHAQLLDVQQQCAERFPYTQQVLDGRRQIGSLLASLWQSWMEAVNGIDFQSVLADVTKPFEGVDKIVFKLLDEAKAAIGL